MFYTFLFVIQERKKEFYIFCRVHGMESCFQNLAEIFRQFRTLVTFSE